MTATADCSIRRRILYSVILIAALVGFPIWLTTTSIHRATLPEPQIFELGETVLDGIHYRVPIYLQGFPQNLAEESQKIIDARTSNIDTPLNVEFHLETESTNANKLDYKIKLVEVGGTKPAYKLSPREDRLLTIFLPKDYPESAQFIASVITDGLFKEEISRLAQIGKEPSESEQKRQMMRIPYSTNYQVSVSMLEESDDPIHWNLTGISQSFEKFLASLSEYANFTLETQVGYYNSLLDTANLENSTDGSLVLKDSSTFMDYSEWGLDQDVEMSPSINLVMYVPDHDKKIVIDGSTKTNSFLVPQWGGVVIYNGNGTKEMGVDRLYPVFDIFASQVFKLLGAPEQPKSAYIRTDILTRIQVVENLAKSADNLLSLVKLTKQLMTIPIPEVSLKAVDETIRLIDQTTELMQRSDPQWWVLANQLSSRALTLSDKAFFQKDMVQQAYFPEDHKMAVYMPLLGPFLTILLLGIARMFKETRRTEKLKKQ